MALISCPDCRQPVSDQAPACPHCGRPLKPQGPTAAAPAGLGELESLIRQTLLAQGKIAAIKLLRDRQPGLGLAEAKGLVERIESALPPDQRPPKPQGCSVVLACIAVVVLGLALWMIWALGHPASSATR